MHVKIADNGYAANAMLVSITAICAFHDMVQTGLLLLQVYFVIAVLSDADPL